MSNNYRERNEATDSFTISNEEIMNCFGSQIASQSSKSNYDYQNEYKENNEINYGYLLIGLISFYINYIDFNYTIIDPCEDIPFIIDYTLENIPMIIEPISKQNAAKTIYKIFNVIECLRDTYEDIFRIIQTNENNNNLIFELLKEYSLNQEKKF